MVHRLKQHIKDPETGQPLFKTRQVTPCPVPFDWVSRPAFPAHQQAFLTGLAPRLRQAVRERHGEFPPPGTSGRQSLVFRHPDERVLLDYPNVRFVPLPLGECLLEVPITRSSWLPDHGSDATGIAPDRPLPQDVDGTEFTDAVRAGLVIAY